MAGSPTSRRDVGHRGISWGEEEALLKFRKNEHLVIFCFSDFSCPAGPFKAQRNALGS